MNRQQLSLIVILGLLSPLHALAGEPSNQTAEWRSTATEAAASTLSGKLYRNSADQNHSAPYLLLDHWGAVRGYVAAAPGVDLEPSIGQQVTLQGSVKTLAGGEMAYITCESVLGGNDSVHQAPTATPTAASVVALPVNTLQQPVEVAQSATLNRHSTPAEPAQLHEVVLENSQTRSDEVAPRRTVTPARRSNGRTTRYGRVQQTNYAEIIPRPAAGMREGHPIPSPSMEPAPIAEGEMEESEGPHEERAGCDSCNHGGCDGGGCSSGCGMSEECDDGCGMSFCGPRRPLFCLGPTGIWVKADYLLWWERGMHVPALVTSGPTPQQPGYLGEQGTKVLFGDTDINDRERSGGRLQAGAWLNPCATFGIEGEYLALGDATTDFHLWSDGNPIVSRPFYDVGRTAPVENIEKVAYPRGSPGSLDGSIDITARTTFHAAGAHFLFTTCCDEGCWTDECGGCGGCGITYHDSYRANFIVGYRNLNLEDQLGIEEDLTSTTPTFVSTNSDTQGVSAFLVKDQFNTANSFNGGDIGMQFQVQRNRWSLDLFPRVALGNTHSVVDITGSTRTTSPAGVQTLANGGLLALSTNIGHYTRDSFTVVPEIDMTGGFQVTKHAKIVLGYNFLYWSKVARAGEQIDRSVNSTLLPNSGATVVGDTTRPRFDFIQTSFWAQGVNVGLECRW